MYGDAMTTNDRAARARPDARSLRGLAHLLRALPRVMPTVAGWTAP